MGRFDIPDEYFEGNKNLTKGNRSNGMLPILSEILREYDTRVSPVGHHRHVDSNAPPGGDGSPGRPYKTIMDAVRDIEEHELGTFAPGVAHIAGGDYPENVRIHKSDVHLVGIGYYSERIRIRPETGPSLVISNATDESIDEYLLSDDYSDLETQGDRGPSNNEYHNLVMSTPTGMGPAVKLLGVPGADHPDWTRFGIHQALVSCVLQGGPSGADVLFARNAMELIMLDVLIGQGTGMTAINCGFLNLRSCGHSNIHAELIESDPLGSSYYAYYGLALAVLQYCDVSSDNGAGGLLFKKTEAVFDSFISGTFGNPGCAIEVQDAGAAFNAVHHEGSLTVDGLTDLDLNNVYIKGPLSIGSGAGVATARRLSVRGTITDADGKLQWEQNEVNGGVVNGAQSQKEHFGFGSSGVVKRTGAMLTQGATQAHVIAATLEDDAVYWAKMRVTGRQSDGSNRATYVRSCQVYRDSGGSATLGAGGVQADFTDETNAAWDATFTVSGNDLRVSVTGAAATDINWAATLEIQGIS